MSDTVCDDVGAGAQTPDLPRLDRRTTLTWLAGALAAGLPGGAAIGAPRKPAGAHGYGLDPNLLDAKAPWPRIMTPAALRTAALLCDFILPASGEAPSATAVGVPDFIDEWVSAPYPAQVADRALVLGGLTWLEAEARRRHGVGLGRLAAAERGALFEGLTRPPADPAGAEPHRFFRTFRGLVVGAYYTTEAGFRDIGYVGNVAMTSYPGPSAEVTRVLDARLKALGL